MFVDVPNSNVAQRQGRNFQMICNNEIFNCSETGVVSLEAKIEIQARGIGIKFVVYFTQQDDG